MSAVSKVLIYDLDLEQLVAQLNIWGEPPYRAKQVWEGLYLQLWSKPEEFTNLSKPLRQKLQQCFSFSSLNEVERFFSTDQKTTKVLFRLLDGPPIETVLMRYAERRTVCISTQAGCALGCVFCATGQMGFRRNLSSGEIVEQVLVFARQLNDEAERPTNVVLMGMGEPLLNYDNVLPALRVMLDDHAHGLSRRRVTLSTAGLVPLIDRLREDCPVSLAVSLHAARNDLRDEIVPLNRQYPIAELLDACRRYVERQPHRRVIFEYIMLDGVNDTPEDARVLIALLRDIPAKVNLIPFNPFPQGRYRRSSPENVERFQSILADAGLTAITRRTRGDDIDAACGQLAGRVTDRTRRAPGTAGGQP